jgi:hypothetical protein
MQPSTMTTILILVITTIFTVFGWFIREVLKKIHYIENTLNKHIVDDTEIQTALNINMASQIKMVEKLDGKLDQIHDKIEQRDARIDIKISELSDKIE